MAELRVGAEWDRAAQRRMKVALLKAGAKRVARFWGILGSQEIFDATFVIAGGRVRINVEAYVGITISGDDEAIAILSRHL
ncbi:MAG: hypothetical protein HYU62_08975 [Caulobacterales bacterium]|nr:hypothetical protein [Caulobacterales bacterium]